MKSRIEQQIKNFGFQRFGFAALTAPLSMEHYRQWIKDQYHGEMAYLETHVQQKQEAHRVLPSAQSAIVVAIDYLPHPHPTSTPIKKSRVALYARGEDYHHWFKKQLQALALALKDEFSDHEFLAITDSGPVLERDLAYRAGLGWVGKNTCLIDQKNGSLFFIGEIYCSLPPATFELGSSAVALHPDRCGTCTRCIDACPTQALVEAKKLDATKCISYWTIESKSNPPLALRPHIGDWLFGCDICQTVCPWNEKAFGKSEMQAMVPKLLANDIDLIDELHWILSTSNKQIQKKLHGSPLLRAGGVGLKRNALIITANHKLAALRADVVALVDHPRLGDLAQWTLDQL
ncbi:MAG: tRNA epoxyqueuosine(34) reductase QueG [Pseudobdellovibrionaceae bacterium]|nr:MAG: tRNA epoxyqueuosine(34) reductase QueG [Pseudobdellovibrionaceae bacterium]